MDKSPKPTAPSPFAYTVSVSEELSDDTKNLGGHGSFLIRSRATLTLIARALLANHMDFERTVEKLFPKYTPEKRAVTVAYLETHPELQAEVEEQLKVPGLDEASKQEYVRELWMWFWSTDNELKTTAARILGKALIPEKTDDKPEKLTIAGMEEGLKTMGLIQPSAFDAGTGFDNPDNKKMEN